MTEGTATTIWARAFADELARCGVQDVVIAPGSRSTPLVMAFARDGRFRMRVHLDERSGAFFALGIAKASGSPAAIITTSGTATANVFPAVIEASLSEAPLLVLTADRPHRLRGADANQTIDQVGLYGTYVREFIDVPPPVADGPALQHLRTVAVRSVATSLTAPFGPVHINFPFDKPLEPVDPDPEFVTAHPIAANGRTDGNPFVEISVGRTELSEQELDRLASALAAKRGVIVAGAESEPEKVGKAALSLSAATGYPILADPLSGARFGPSAGADRVAAYDLFLRDEGICRALNPDLVLRVGATPTSAALQAWLQHHNGVRHIVVDAGQRWKDYGSTATDYVKADPEKTLGALVGRVDKSVDQDWASLWHTASRAARHAIDADEGDLHEGDVLATVAEVLPEGGNLFISSSMPVRDLDSFGLPREEQLMVFGNRGASGIDGIVSSAFGVAAARPAPTVCVLGDIAFFHDQNGLLWSREPDCPVVFVLIDNDGGGIFHMLPITDHEPAFSQFFATPHGLDFQHAAGIHNLDWSDLDISDLGTALASALESGRTSILRVTSDRETNTRRHEEIAEAVAQHVLDTLR